MDRCKVCGLPLRNFETIFAVEGCLYCSEECGRKKTEDFDNLAEEVVPSDIGIR